MSTKYYAFEVGLETFGDRIFEECEAILLVSMSYDTYGAFCRAESCDGKVTLLSVILKEDTSSYFSGIHIDCPELLKDIHKHYLAHNDYLVDELLEAIDMENVI